MYLTNAGCSEKKTYPNDFPLIRPLDLETLLYQLLEDLCMLSMLIKLISLKKNVSERFSRHTSISLGNAALSTSRSPMYVNKADFTKETLIRTIFP